MVDKTLSPAERFSRLLQHMQKMDMGELPMIDEDLTLSQMRVLHFVGQHAGCHLQDIAEGLNLTAPSVSVTVRRLEELGKVVREQDPQDGRAACIQLTPASQDMLEKMNNYQQMAAAQFLAGLSPHEQQQFVNLFERALNAHAQKNA